MFKESRHILKEALETFTKLYGEESAEVAEVLTRLGGAYFEWSQFQESWYANNHNKIKVHSVPRLPIIMVFKTNHTII